MRISKFEQMWLTTGRQAQRQMKNTALEKDKKRGRQSETDGDKKQMATDRQTETVRD